MKLILTALATIMLAAPADAAWEFISTSGTYQAIQITGSQGIAVFCQRGGKPILSIETGAWLGQPVIGPFVSVEVQVDGKPSENYRGVRDESPATTIAMVLDLDAGLLYQMRRGSNIRTKVRNKHRGSFSLAGFTRVSNQLAPYCDMPRGWNTGAYPAKAKKDPTPKTAPVKYEFEDESFDTGSVAFWVVFLLTVIGAIILSANQSAARKAQMEAARRQAESNKQPLNPVEMEAMERAIRNDDNKQTGALLSAGTTIAVVLLFLFSC